MPLDYLFEEYRNVIFPSEMEKFDSLILQCVKKSISALLDASVDDSAIHQVVIENWGITQEDFFNILREVKKEKALNLLKCELSYQGYSSTQADNFIRSNMIGIHLSNTPELLKQWNNPEKIIKTVQRQKKNKEK